MSDRPTTPFQEQSPPSEAWRWRIVGLLFLATVLNYLDRQTLAVCAPLIRDEFKLTNENYGWLLSAFRWTYAAMLIPAGFLADRVAVRVLYPMAVLAWSLAGAAAAVARTPFALAATRAGLGVGESFNWPCGLRVTANVLPDRDRGLGNGIFQSGTAVGAMLAPLIIAPIALSWGWRTAFLLVGGLGVVWVILWQLVTHGHPVDTPATDRKTEPLLSVFQTILTHPGFWLLAVAAATINPCLYFLAEWLPNYLHGQRSFGVLWAGLATVPVFIGADLGNIGGGWLVRRRMAGGWSLARSRGLAVMLGAALAACAIPANATSDPYLCVAFLGLSAAGVGVVMANWLTCIQEISFAGVGLTMGLLGAVGCVAGAVINPYIGRYVDQTGHYDFVFLLLGTVPAVTVVTILLFDTAQSHRSDPEAP